jgi:hypothetical protein
MSPRLLVWIALCAVFVLLSASCTVTRSGEGERSLGQAIQVGAVTDDGGDDASSDGGGDVSSEGGDDASSDGGDDASSGDDASTDDGGTDAWGPGADDSTAADASDGSDVDAPCVPAEQVTMLGFGAQPLSFDECDQAVRKVAAIPIDQAFLAAVTSPDGLAKCTAVQHCAIPDPTTGVTGPDPTGPTCHDVISTYVPQHLNGSMLPAIEIVQLVGCPEVSTCIVSHGGLAGGDYAFGPVPLDGVTCPGAGGSATSLTTTQVLQVYGYADGQGSLVEGLPASVIAMAKTIGENLCNFGSGGYAGGPLDAGGASGCGQYAQYANAYGSGLSMGAGRLAGDDADAIFVSNVVSGALHASAAVNVDGVDCSQLGLTRDYNLVGFPVLSTTGDPSNDASTPVETAALPNLVELAFATRIGLTSTQFPDLSPGGVPMSTFNGTGSALPVQPYTSADQVPAVCPPLQGDTRMPLLPSQEFSGTRGAPNWVQIIPASSFNLTVKGAPVQMVLTLTDPCCNPT